MSRSTNDAPLSFTISADAEYLQAVGRAFYNFAYMEWRIVHGISRLRQCPMWEAPAHQSGGSVAPKLDRAIKTTKLRLPGELTKELKALVVSFRAAVDERNNLLHSVPFTDEDGSQRLGGKGHRKWRTQDVLELAKSFEDLSHRVGALLGDELMKFLPA